MGNGAFYRLGLYSTNSSGNCCFKAATVDLPDAARRKLFADNAVAFYRIDLPTKED